MDYKEVAAVLRWHALYSAMNGAEARTIIFMATSANHKTGKLSMSYRDIADAIGLSKVTIAKTIASLIEKKSISVDEYASGRMTATYRIRTTTELNEYFMVESNNPEVAQWHTTHDQKFAALVDKHDAINDGCEECTDDELCPMHNYHVKKFEDQPEWREYKLWLADNEKPELKVRTIKNKRVQNSKDAP